MKATFYILLIVAFVTVGLGFIKASKKLTPIHFIVPKGWKQPTYNFKENPITKEGFELGKKLFYDPNLSKDSTTSCASCHQQFAAFATFDHNLSHGIGNQISTRNAPALQNLAWQTDFMADGSIHHLDSQPIAPLTAPNEMGMNIDELIMKISSQKEYKSLFKTAFNSNVITIKLVTKALSQFMLLLVSSNSKYDKVMHGEAKFILPEQLGYDIFKTKCASCHTEPMFTDYTYRNIGLPLDRNLKDEGRKKVTQDKNDSLKFRVPSLRNVAVTMPYGHDGRFFSLYNVFEHYRKNVISSNTTDPIVANKLPLSNYEIGQLTAFLQTLTDSAFITNTMFAPINFNTKPSFRDKH